LAISIAVRFWRASSDKARSSNLRCRRRGVAALLGEERRVIADRRREADAAGVAAVQRFSSKPACLATSAMRASGYQVKSQARRRRLTGICFSVSPIALEALEQPIRY
jgi:hypothetical protein